MPTNFSYEMSFNGLPFALDFGGAFRPPHAGRAELADKVQAPAKYQDEPTLLEELDRIIPAQYLQDFLPLGFQGSRTLNALAQHTPNNDLPNRTLKVGQWYYPTGASRWSVFRGLVPSSIAKELTAACFTGGPQAKPFVVKAVPVGQPTSAAESGYTVETDMYLLPPRPLAEHGGTFDGLFLVTLVDERWYWQWSNASLQPWEPPVRAARTTWESLLETLATALGIELTLPEIDGGFLYPEPDSQLWASKENAAVLLDAVAHNLLLTVVRNLDGTYQLMTDSASQTLAESNRGSSVVRMAGGDMFSDDTRLPAGDLSASREAIVPASVDVCFPKYVEPNYSGPAGGDQLNPANAAGAPVPYLWNSRYRNKRPSAWQEDSYADVYTKNVPIAEGGDSVTGLTGKGTHTIHSTAKAIYRTEADAAPSNQSELDTLATLLAQGYYEDQAITGLDEVYPGTLLWEPEGLHDLLWTYSATVRQASLRVMRTPWNTLVRTFQHSASYVPRGVGGPAVAQSIRDAFSGSISTLCTLRSGSFTATLASPDNLPTQNRWRGLIDSEKVLFNGTSGGTTVTVAARGIDGTSLADHSGGTSVTQIVPNVTYGVNLTTTEKMQAVYPAEWTSGGIQGVRIVPQTQTVYCFDGSGEVYNGLRHFSGQVRAFDAVAGTYPAQEFVWLIERNEAELRSGLKYNGQFAWTSKGAPRAAPIYLVEDIVQQSGASSGEGDLYLQLSGRYYNFVLNSGYRRIFIEARGRVTFPSFAPTSGVKLEIINYPGITSGGGGKPLRYEVGAGISGTTPAGVIATPGVSTSSGNPPVPSPSRASDVFQYPNQAKVVESLGGGGGWGIENATQKTMPQVGCASVAITKGQPVAQAPGTTDGVPNLRPATATQGDPPYAANVLSGRAIGLAVDDIDAGDFGEYTPCGPIYGVWTSGFSAGDELYLNRGGGFTTLKFGASSGAFKQKLATVLVGGTADGIILGQTEPPRTVFSGEIAYDVVHSGHIGSGQVASGHLASGLLNAAGGSSKKASFTVTVGSGLTSTVSLEVDPQGTYSVNWWGIARSPYTASSSFTININTSRTTRINGTPGTFTETGIVLGPDTGWPFNSNVMSGGKIAYPEKMEITFEAPLAAQGFMPFNTEYLQ